jgi:hypothetical protein
MDVYSTGINTSNLGTCMLKTSKPIFTIVLIFMLLIYYEGIFFIEPER